MTIYASLLADLDADCRWTVGPIPKFDGHTCICSAVKGHRLPHSCECGSVFEGCGRPGRAS